MKTLSILLALMILVGCDSGRDAKLQEDQRNYAAVAKAQQDGLQWELDKATAEKIFWRYYSDAPPETTHEYEMFIKCHEEPPTHDANKKACAALQARVAKQEAKDEAQSRAEKAAW